MFLFFNDTATTEIYTLSLHDALPIWSRSVSPSECASSGPMPEAGSSSSSTSGSVARTVAISTRFMVPYGRDRKSTRLNSSHANISYAVFCLKKKFQQKTLQPHKLHHQ